MVFAVVAWTWPFFSWSPWELCNQNEFSNWVWVLPVDIANGATFRDL